ncbi:hok/gef family protein, partial [Escherichia coli]|nr:hok/gef family protein [Escherichia coli]
MSEPFRFRQDAGTRKAKTPLVNPLTREVCMKYLNTTDCSLFLAE